MAFLIVTSAFLIVGGIVGSYSGTRTREERSRVTKELLVLGALVANAVGILRYYGNTDWGAGVATGFLSVAVYDLARKLPAAIGAKPK